MKNNCKFFDENKMASYLDNRMKSTERKIFEEHLFNCDFCLKIYHNLQEEALKIEAAQFSKIPEPLLQNALKKLNLLKSKKKKIPEFTQIVIKLYKKGMELIEAINVQSLTPIPVTPVRGREKLNLLKEVVVESDIKGALYKLFIDFYDQNRVKISLNFLAEPDNFKNRNIKIVNSDGEILHSFSKEAYFDDLSKGIYKIKINGTTLSQLNLQ